MRPERPLLPPSTPPLPPQQTEEAAGRASVDVPDRLPDPVPSPILRHSPASSTRRSRSLRSVMANSPSVTFAEDIRSGSKAESSASSFENFQFRLAGSMTGTPAGVARVSTRRSASERAGSQRDLRDEDARFVYINDADHTNAPPARFPDNGIHTTKYSILTFVPRNLYEQFHRVAYVYFLILAALNQVPQLGVFSPVASILPLAFVLGVTAVKDAYEDWRRHRSDKTENNRTASVLVGGVFRPKRWKEIQVGEVVRVVANETLPCDMVLLSTSDPTGVAYVQTINLDGESNLKTRYAKQETMPTPPEALAGIIKCEKPNRNIYGFLATVDLDGRGAVSLGPSNIVLRGCEIKNTTWAIGVAVYTGRDTKVMLNNSGAPSKRSRLETHMNRETIVLTVVLVLLCSIVTLLAGIWLGDHSDELAVIPYFRKKDFSSSNADGTYKWYGAGPQVVFTFMMAVIQFQVMIPIALFISMELSRVGQAYFMVQDKHMFDGKRQAKFQCRALNINEDLGQIKYVFSDKTGTLTENQMEFRCASVHGGDFSDTDGGGGDGHSVTGEDGVVLRPKTAVKTDPKLMALLKDGAGEKAVRARDFFLTLATCNTIVPIVVDTPDPAARLLEYQGESPDEQALVYAAAAYGYTLVERTSGHIIVDVFGTRQRYDVLGLHEFDSDRKRMSVIVGCPDKTVKLFVKGADSSMFGVIDKSMNSDVVQATEKHLHSYSSIGLRTLVIGMRELSQTEFQEWQIAYEKASTSLLGRGNLLRGVATNIERNLRLLGASGIEDKLQDGVPEAIEKLRQAGIKVWVLTGDKQETAISIGYSCKLLTRDMTQIVINSHSRESCRKILDDAVSMVNKLRSFSTDPQAKMPLALIIDGNSLVYIFDTDREEKLFEVAKACDVVLCCRVAPLQKAGIVDLIKKRTSDMTLAIGDGANDVSMIQMADVGIGISGQEGRQAVMASDFAMGQFRFLVPLLLVHGHWNYQRMGYMILYNFYRNATFVFVLFWYVLYTGFTLTTAITEWSSVLYSVIYTAVPTIVVAILDKDLSRRTLLKYPQLYGAGQREENYNLRLFIFIMLDSIWQSLAIFFIPYLAYRKSVIDGASLGDLWTLSVVILVNIHLAMDVIRWNWITHAAIWGSIAATWICVMIIDSIPIMPGFWAIYKMMGTGLFWALLLAVTVVAMIPHFVAKAFREYFTPNDIQIAREMEKSQDLHDATHPEVQMSTVARA
ncbi:phospholipid-transporting ATPase 1-like isoform X1 [Phragmites australis]|uniref:phospholipid-transporting ATPase 1-like isoform X1 n=1 Tax=Phragmites australis TaxID=29695 RepID=UPI002D77F80F|nr:phospholipid-transporting ATPase 1-like isoform X1 [Phragmites australis]